MELKNYSKSMDFQSVTVQNYRSIEKEVLNITKIDGGYTYALIGINESGKSNFLKAIALKEGLEKVSYPIDFHDTTRPISISFDYLLNDEGLDLWKANLKINNFPEELLVNVNIGHVFLKVSFEPIASMVLKKSIELDMDQGMINNYTLKGGVIVKKDESQVMEGLNLKKYLEDSCVNYFFGLSHQVVFWRSEPKYLIIDPINLDSFARDPKSVSIPLKNCFELAGISNVSEQITKIKNNPAENKNLTDKLEDTVTAHIKRIWPGHPINIKFNIEGSLLSFLVADKDVKYKTKTTGQRSDGFRQFISFLLTVSAQNTNAQLSNSLLLIDEPETHLHPNGQENLRDELVRISKGDFNNIVIFATHSNYMIDKDHIERCYRVFKENNEITKITQLNGPKSSYSEINYLVFDVPTSDHHNELYGHLQEREERFNEKEFEDYLKTKGIDLKKSYKKLKGGKSHEYKTTLPTYIRNLIHHPENTENDKFSDQDLRESIEILRKIKNEKN